MIVQLQTFFYWFLFRKVKKRYLKSTNIGQLYKKCIIMWNQYKMAYFMHNGKRYVCDVRTVQP